jgi:hypothetical protein
VSLTRSNFRNSRVGAKASALKPNALISLRVELRMASSSSMVDMRETSAAWRSIAIHLKE